MQCHAAKYSDLKLPKLFLMLQIGITQKYLVVTTSYEARRRGITKLMGIAEARQKCPDLMLVSGEDLGPYRAASRAILDVLRRFGVSTEQPWGTSLQKLLSWPVSSLPLEHASCLCLPLNSNGCQLRRLGGSQKDLGAGRRL